MESLPEMNHYSGYRKLRRISSGVSKNLAMLGKSINLFTADFNTIEKFASLIQVEKHLRWRVDNGYGNPKAQNCMYKILLQIADNKPTVTGFLNKARLFELANNSWEGYRITNKPHLRQTLKEAFPHCFRYDANDVSDVKMGKLATIMEFNPQPVKVTYVDDAPNVGVYGVVSDIISSDAFHYVALLGLLSFVSGSVYGYILFKGLNRT